MRSRGKIRIAERRRHRAAKVVPLWRSDGDPERKERRSGILGRFGSEGAKETKYVEKARVDKQETFVPDDSALNPFAVDRCEPDELIRNVRFGRYL